MTGWSWVNPPDDYTGYLVHPLNIHPLNGEPMPHQILPEGPGEHDATTAPPGPEGFQTPGQILGDYTGHTPAGPDLAALQERADLPPLDMKSARDWLMAWVGQQPGVDAVRVAVGYGNPGKAFRFYMPGNSVVEVTLREVTE